MRIDFESSGGYANLRLEVHAATEEMPPALARELEAMVRDSGALDLDPATLAPGAAGPPDAVSYRLSLADGPRRVSLYITDATAPASLQPLLAGLRKLSLEQRREGG